MIAKIWNFFFYACRHKWQIYDEVSLIHKENWNAIPHGMRYTLQCDKCGILKQKDIK